MYRIKVFYRKLQNLILNTFFYDEKSIALFWHKKPHNFGDVLNPIIVNKLFNKKVKHVNSKYYNREYYLVIGSVLGRATKHSIVWGSGFISSDSRCKEKPKKVLAVRGPKSREILLQQGIDCPEVYGDPALLLPRIYNPPIDKKYKLGIVPHFVDKNNKWLEHLKGNEDILILDVLEKDIYKFIDDIKSCQKIASSSLHGIIVSDAYNIPSVWIEFSKNVKGNGFKFQDYFLSVKRKDNKPIIINNDMTVDDILEAFSEYEIDIDLDKLVNSSPFNL